MGKKVLLALAVVFVILGIAAQGNATLVEFKYHTIFSGTAVPAPGSDPWLTAKFDDGGSSGSVTLTLSVWSGLPSTEFVSGFYFNTDPAKTGIASTYLTGSTGSGEWSPNAYKADGDGSFDLLFSFPTAESGDRFTPGETATFSIAGTGITANSFLYLSSPAAQGLYTAAHIQGIPSGTGTTSVWATVPIPGAAWLLATGLLGLVVIRRRMKK